MLRADYVQVIDLRVEGCKDCDGLWDRYRVAVLEYTRLDSQMKLARLRYEQEMATLQGKLQEAEKERDEVRRLIVEHEQTTHPESRLTVFE